MAKEKEKKSTALTKPTQASGAIVNTNVPEYLRTATPDGFENMGQGDLIVPRLGLCQELSPQRKKSKPNFIDGLKVGEFFNTVTSKNYGGTVQIIPLTFYKSRIRFHEELGKGILCQSLDARVGVGEPGGNCATCPMSRFGSAKKGKGQACTEFYNYPSLIVPEKGPVTREN